MSVSNANARALSLMDKIALRTGLSPAAELALIQLVNPFADFEAPKVGYFDTNESSSVVSCVRLSSTITVPSNVTASNNWDCHVFSTPFTNTSPTAATNVWASSISAGNLFVSTTGGPAGSNVGGVTVVAGTAGAPLNLVNSSNAAVGLCTSAGLAPTLSQIAVGFGSGYLDGQCRVIGMGFEVHNTTAPLTVQGAVAVYRLPQTTCFDRQTAHFATTAAPLAPASATFGGDVTMATMYDVPGSVANVLLLNGSRQWEAKDGCMIVPTLADVSIPAQRLSNFAPVAVGPATSVNLAGIGGNTQSGFSAATIGTGSTTVTYSVGSVVNAFPGIPLTHINNFNTGGAYFTGLSYTTTLVINTIYYIEFFPNPSNQALVVLANPSPPFSAIAMDLYPEMLRHLPVGVKVCDNADGDWFFEAVKSVGSFLANPLTALGGPMGVAFGAAANVASTWADNKLKERNKQIGGNMVSAQAGKPVKGRQAPPKTSTTIIVPTKKEAKLWAAGTASDWKYPPNVTTKAQKKAFREKNSGWHA